MVRIFFFKSPIFFSIDFVFYRFARKVTSRATQSMSVLNNTLLLKKKTVHWDLLLVGGGKSIFVEQN